MTKTELKTQADRWKYLVNGGKLTDGFDILVIKNGELWDETEDKYSSLNLTGTGWRPYIEPMKDEFEIDVEVKWIDRDSSVGCIATCILDKYIDRRVKIVITEIV